MEKKNILVFLVGGKIFHFENITDLVRGMNFSYTVQNVRESEIIFCTTFKFWNKVRTTDFC